MVVVAADWAKADCSMAKPPATAERQRAAASKVILFRMCFGPSLLLFAPKGMLPLYLDNILSGPAFVQAGPVPAQHSAPGLSPGHNAAKAGVKRPFWQRKTHPAAKLGG